MRPVLVVLATLVGCGSEHERLLTTWEGVYRVEGHAVDLDGCDDPLEAAADAPYLELVAQAGTEADLIDLRWCAEPSDCDRVGFLTLVAPVAREGRIEGAHDELFYAAPGLQAGLCQVVHEAASITREGVDAPAITITIESGAASDASATDEAACVALLERLAADPEGCDALRVLQARSDEP